MKEKLLFQFVIRNDPPEPEPEFSNEIDIQLKGGPFAGRMTLLGSEMKTYLDQRQRIAEVSVFAHCWHWARYQGIGGLILIGPEKSWICYEVIKVEWNTDSPIRLVCKFVSDPVFPEDAYWSPPRKPSKATKA